MAFGKDELFATLDGTEKSKTRYFKTFAIIAVVVLVLIAVGMYFYLPGTGDEVRAPAGMEDAVRSHLASAEKRDLLEMKSFYCKTYYAAQVKVDKPLVAKPSSEKVTNNYDVAATRHEDGSWTVTAMPDYKVDNNDRPCWSR
jgi:hypothetical protein